VQYMYNIYAVTYIRIHYVVYKMFEVHTSTTRKLGNSKEQVTAAMVF